MLLNSSGRENTLLNKLGRLFVCLIKDSNSLRTTNIAPTVSCKVNIDFALIENESLTFSSKFFREMFGRKASIHVKIFNLLCDHLSIPWVRRGDNYQLILTRRVLQWLKKGIVTVHRLIVVPSHQGWKEIKLFFSTNWKNLHYIII